jgi:hypothetical protein
MLLVFEVSRFYSRCNRGVEVSMNNFFRFSKYLDSEIFINQFFEVFSNLGFRILRFRDFEETRFKVLKVFRF